MALLAQWDAEGNLVPVLAAEVPSCVNNGGLAADGRSVLWRLKKGVAWHDGTPSPPMTCSSTGSNAIDTAAATVTIGNYRGRSGRAHGAGGLRQALALLAGPVLQAPRSWRYLFAAWHGRR